jgi:hypothetical protein
VVIEKAALILITEDVMDVLIGLLILFLAASLVGLTLVVTNPVNLIKVGCYLSAHGLAVQMAREYRAEKYMALKEHSLRVTVHAFE